MTLSGPRGTPSQPQCAQQSRSGHESLEAIDHGVDLRLPALAQFLRRKLALIGSLLLLA